MGLYPYKYGLKDDATVKDINAFKKQSNWGEIPAFFSLVASSVAEVEGYIAYGFDNAYKQIIDRKNWNYDKLGQPNVPQLNSLELLEPLTKPQICLLHVFSESGYELLAFPYVNGKVVDEYTRGDKNMGFLIWNPTTMKTIAKVSQLHKFISFTLNNGDDADMALIIRAHLIVQDIIEKLKSEVNVVGVKGMDIQTAFSKHKESPLSPPEETIIASQMDQSS